MDIPTIVIPYRNRSHHLKCVLARFTAFPVVVVEQTDNELFNRGALLNIGYNYAQERGATRIILHDCDLVPDDTLLTMYREPWPRPIVHFGARFRRYNNSRKYFGGVHGVQVGHFPGYPNHFWGWGGEDDALRQRVQLNDVTYATKGEYLDLEGFPRARDKLRTLSKDVRCNNRWELLANDDPRHDNHRRHTLRYNLHWDDADEANVTIGRVSFCR